MTDLRFRGRQQKLVKRICATGKGPISSADDTRLKTIRDTRIRAPPDGLPQIEPPPVDNWLLEIKCDGYRVDPSRQG